MKMSGYMTMENYDLFSEDKNIATSPFRLLQSEKKKIKAFKRKAIANKKGLFKGKYNQLHNYNQIFINLMKLPPNLMKIQHPHPELDPRLKYKNIYLQPAHPSYSKSVLQLLSYALSSSLNNYYLLLKERKIVVVRPPKTPEVKNRSIQAKKIKPKKTQFIKQKNTANDLAKNQPQKFEQEPIQAQTSQKCSSGSATIPQNSIQAYRNSIQKLGTSISSHQSKRSLNLDKQEEISIYSNQKLLTEAKLPKLGIGTIEKQLIREAILMRLVTSFPVKQKPNGSSREIRSLYK